MSSSHFIAGSYQIVTSMKITKGAGLDPLRANRVDYDDSFSSSADTSRLSQIVSVSSIGGNLKTTCFVLLYDAVLY